MCTHASGVKIQMALHNSIPAVSRSEVGLSSLSCQDKSHRTYRLRGMGLGMNWLNSSCWIGCLLQHCFSCWCVAIDKDQLCWQVANQPQADIDEYCFATKEQLKIFGLFRNPNPLPLNTRETLMLRWSHALVWKWLFGRIYVVKAHWALG